MLSASHLLDVCVCGGGGLPLTPIASPAEIIQQELVICGASSGQLASLPAIVHQKWGLAAKLAAASPPGLSRMSGIVDGPLGIAGDHWIIADHWIPGSEGTARMHRVLSAPALTPHSPCVKGH